MRAVVQRVSRASVKVDNAVCGAIDKGLLVLLGVEDEDTADDVAYLTDKICNLRIFEDNEEKMNLSLTDVGGGILVVSQFTLHGDCRKGRRPNFMKAGRPEMAEKLYLLFIEKCREHIERVENGRFQAYMEVELVNDGPVTILIDSKKVF